MLLASFDAQMLRMRYQNMHYFNSESNIEVKILEWEAKCDQNTAAIVVLEAPCIINHTDFV